MSLAKRATCSRRLNSMSDALGEGRWLWPGGARGVPWQTAVTLAWVVRGGERLPWADCRCEKGCTLCER